MQLLLLIKYTLEFIIIRTNSQPNYTQIPAMANAPASQAQVHPLYVHTWFRSSFFVGWSKRQMGTVHIGSEESASTRHVVVVVVVVGPSIAMWRNVFAQAQWLMIRVSGGFNLMCYRQRWDVFVGRCCCIVTACVRMLPRWTCCRGSTSWALVFWDNWGRKTVLNYAVF